MKYFSIDRVFRNETLDATHLAEFHQIEGVVADRGLTLGDLMGILHQFFNKLGPYHTRSHTPCCPSKYQFLNLSIGRYRVYTDTAVCCIVTTSGTGSFWRVLL